MAIDLNRVKSKLEELEKGATPSLKWTPVDGSIVRIVPYKFTPTFPFIETYCYYIFGKKTFISPITFNKPDPVYEFAQKLRATGDKQDYELSLKLIPKARTFSPIIIRGEEDQGVKLWGFGRQVYEQLLGFFNDPDYGDISDISSGRDIAIDYKQPSKQLIGKPKQFPETKIRVKPNISPLVTDKTLLKSLLEDQPVITDLYEEPVYEKLEELLKNWLNPTIEEDNGEHADSSKVHETDFADVEKQLDEMLK